MPDTTSSSRNPWPPIFLISAAITAFLIWWIYLKTAATSDASWISALPAANATFNTFAALAMTGAWLAIRRGHRVAHKRLMLTAVGFSGLFLASYLLYHHYHGDTAFPGQGWVRPAYFAILISHILLSVAMLPMILGSLFFAHRESFKSHKRLARWTLPIWLYVSVTGVVIFFVLRAYV